MIRSLLRGLAIRALAAIVGIGLIVTLALAEKLNGLTALAAFLIWAALHFGLPWLWSGDADSDFPEDRRPYEERYQQRPKGD
jgi:hypothetical protein